MSSNDFSFECINRYGEHSSYTKIIEFKNKSDNFTVIVFDDNGENYSKYNPDESIPHLYDLKEEEKTFAIGTYNLLKNVALTHLNKSPNTKSAEEDE